MKKFSLLSSLFFSFPLFSSSLPTSDQVTDAIFSKNIKALEDCDRNLQQFFLEQKSSKERETLFSQMFWNRPDSIGFTPIWWAVMLYAVTDNEKAIYFLLEKGAKPKDFIKKNLSPEEINLIKTRLKRLSISKSKIFFFTQKVNIPFSVDQSFLPMILTEKNFELKKKCLLAMDPNPYLFHELIFSSNLDLALFFLEKNDYVDANLKFESKAIPHLKGSTLLHLLVTHSAKRLRAEKGEQALFQEIGKEYRFENQSKNILIKKILALLIKKGADPRIKSLIDKRTPIELIKIMGDRRLIHHIYEFCQSSPHEDIRQWAFSILNVQIAQREKAKSELLKLIEKQEEKKRKKEEKREREQSKEEKSEEKSEEKRDEISEEYDWNIIPWVKEYHEKVSSIEKGKDQKKKKKREEQSNLPSFISLNGESMKVVFSTYFFNHVEERQKAVENHDLSEEEIYQTSMEPFLILEKKQERGEIRRIFVGLDEEGQYLRVVYSKKPTQNVWYGITAYRSSFIPFYDREELVRLVDGF